MTTAQIAVMVNVPDQICDLLANRLAAMRKRRDAFERMGNDDAVRIMQGEIDTVKSIADEVLSIVVNAKQGIANA